MELVTLRPRKRSRRTSRLSLPSDSESVEAHGSLRKSHTSRTPHVTNSKLQRRSGQLPLGAHGSQEARETSESQLQLPPDGESDCDASAGSPPLGAHGCDEFHAVKCELQLPADDGSDCDASGWSPPLGAHGPQGAHGLNLGLQLPDDVDFDGACAPASSSMAHGSCEGLHSQARSPFTWPHVVLKTLLDTLGAQLLVSALATARICMSTHFSGLGTAELAASMITAWSRVIVPAGASISHGYACEWSRSARNVLHRRLPGVCVFTDIRSRIVNLTSELQAADEIDFEAAKRCVMNSDVGGHAHCAAHGVQCNVPHCDLDASGSPCPPWSRARKCNKARRRVHKDVLLFLCWCRIILHDRPRLIIHENVIGFDVGLLRELVGHAYHIVECQMHPSDVGFSFVFRPRVFCFLVLRDSELVLYRSPSTVYESVKAALSRPRSVIPVEFLANESELLAEENRARAGYGLPVAGSVSDSWRYLLSTEHERRLEWIEGHITQWKQPYLVDLSQSTDRLRASPCVPTVRHSGSHRLWLIREQRWLLAVEVAAVMGFPVKYHLAALAGVPTETDENISMGLLGNAMHVANIGAALAVFLGCTRAA